MHRIQLDDFTEEKSTPVNPYMHAFLDEGVDHRCFTSSNIFHFITSPFQKMYIYIYIDVNFRSSKRHAHFDDCWEGRRTPLRNKQINAPKETCHTYSLYDTCVCMYLWSIVLASFQVLWYGVSVSQIEVEWRKYDQQVSKNASQLWCLPEMCFPYMNPDYLTET